MTPAERALVAERYTPETPQESAEKLQRLSMKLRLEMASQMVAEGEPLKDVVADCFDVNPFPLPANPKGRRLTEDPRTGKVKYA
jgi:hypothetical protein